jgi:tetratricopeptide (TPR) repeat protein
VVTERLVGRDDVLSQLRREVDAAIAGRGGLVLLVGEAGIGKTAVLEAVVRDAHARPVPVAWGQCWDGSVAPAFWPWTQVLRTLGAPGEQFGDRFELFDGVVSTLAGASSPNGLVVVLDDLQWADDDSIALLSFVAKHLRRTGALVIGAYRGAEAIPPLRLMAADATTVALDPLGVDDAVGLVDLVAGRPLPAGEVADVVQRAGGNPFYVRELTRLVSAARTDGERVAVTASAGVTDVVMRRFDRVSPACRAMLDVAATMGSDVRVDVVRKVLQDGADLPDLLAEAVRGGILVAQREGVGPYRFAHDLLREVVIGTMAPTRAADLHLRVGRALEAMAASGAPASAAAIAAHYVAAASAGRLDAALDAVQHCRYAAAAATAELAFEDAVAHLRRAVACLGFVEQPSQAPHLDVLLELAEALDLAGDAVAARVTYEHVGELARRSDAPNAFARAAIGVHLLGAGSGVARDVNVDLLEEAVRLTDGASPALRARTLAALARELHHAWDAEQQERARAVAHDAVVLAREIDDAATLSFCLLALHDAEWTFGSAERRLPIVDEMRDLARAGGDRELMAEARLLRAAAMMELGDPATLRELERYCTAADGLGHARGRWGALSRRAVAALVHGRFDDARSLGAAAAELGERIGEPDAPGVWDTLRLEIDRFGGGWAHISPSAHWVPSANWPPLRCLLLLANGDADGARAALTGFSLARELAHGVRRHDGWMPLAIASSTAAVGSDDQRVDAYQWLAGHGGRHFVYGGCIGYGGAVDHHLGVLARSLGREDDATMHLERSLRQHEALGAVAWAALDRTMLSTEHSTGLRAGLSAGTPGVERSPVRGDSDVNVLRRDGDVWRITFRGRTSSVRHLKGMLDLAVLLDRPDREVPSLELMGGADVGGAAGPVLDDRARRTYQQRVRELQDDIDDARTANDPGRAERAEAELDALVEQLSQAFGLGGRHRAAGSAAERARAAVTHRVRSAIRRIAAVDAQLGQHLLNSVKTGTWCVYRPEGQIAWRVEWRVE